MKTINNNTLLSAASLVKMTRKQKQHFAFFFTKRSDDDQLKNCLSVNSVSIQCPLTSSIVKNHQTPTHTNKQTQTPRESNTKEGNLNKCDT